MFATLFNPKINAVKIHESEGKKFGAAAVSEGSGNQISIHFDKAEDLNRLIESLQSLAEMMEEEK